MSEFYPFSEANENPHYEGQYSAIIEAAEGFAVRDYDGEEMKEAKRGILSAHFDALFESYNYDYAFAQSNDELDPVSNKILRRKLNELEADYFHTQARLCGFMGDGHEKDVLQCARKAFDKTRNPREIVLIAHLLDKVFRIVSPEAACILLSEEALDLTLLISSLLVRIGDNIGEDLMIGDIDLELASSLLISTRKKMPYSWVDDYLDQPSNP